MEPLVSIIIITYNYERFICEAVDSALNQTYQNIEVLIVDDGSTDNTAELIQKRYGQRVEYIDRKNGGLSAARNTGIDHARGEYFCFLDSDDILYPDFIRGHVEYLENNNGISILTANSEYFGQLQGIVRPQLYGRGDREFTYIDFVSDNLVAGIHTVMIRKDVFTICGRFDPNVSHSEDHEFWLRCLRKVRMVYRDAIVARYRFHGLNHCLSTKQMEDNIEIFLRSQLSKNLTIPEQNAVHAELVHNAIRPAWKEGNGRHARQLIRQYRQMEKHTEKPTWHLFIASILPYGMIMEFRRFLGKLKILPSVPEIKT